MAEGLGTPGAIVAACSLIEPTAAATLRRHAAVGRVRGIRDMTLPPDVELTDIAVRSTRSPTAGCRSRFGFRSIDSTPLPVSPSTGRPSPSCWGAPVYRWGRRLAQTREWASASLSGSSRQLGVQDLRLIGRLGSDWSRELPVAVRVRCARDVRRPIERCSARTGRSSRRSPTSGRSLRPIAPWPANSRRPTWTRLCHRTASRAYGFERADEQ